MSTMPHDTSEQSVSAEPIRIRDSRGILELTKALGNADKAWVVWTLRGWVAHNQARNKAYRDGHYWTFSPLSKWQAKHFPWITLKRLSTMMVQLVNQGVLIRTRRSVHCCYWYRVDESILTSLCASLPPVNSLAPKTAELISQTAELKDKTSDQFAQTAEHKTVVIKQENLKEQKLKQQETTAAAHIDNASETAAAAVMRPRFEPEAETGELNLHGEGQDHPRQAFKARHKDGSNDAPISKVPLKVLPSPLSETAAALIEDMRHVYGALLAEGHAENLIRQHGEDRVRAVHWYTESRMSEWDRPVAYLTHELRNNTVQLQPCSADEPNPYKPEETSLSEVLSAQAARAHIDYEAELLAELEAREHIAPPAPPKGLGEKIGGSMTAGEIWQTAHSQLKHMFDRPSFDMWLKDAQPLGYELATGTMTIGVPSAHAQDMLQHRYYRNVQRVVEGLANAPTALVFEMCPPLAPQQRPLSDSERETLARLREDRALI